MRYLALAACFICVLATACRANDTDNTTTVAPSVTQTAGDKQPIREEIYERARKRNGGNEQTKVELLRRRHTYLPYPEARFECLFSNS